MSNLNREDIEKLKDVFVHTPGMSPERLAGISADIIGREVDVELVKHYVKKEKWVIERNSVRSNEEKNETDDIFVEMDIVRRILFSQIVACAKSGLFISGNFDKDEVVRLLSTVDGIDEISPVSPRGIDHNLVNSYMNLLQKGNFEIKQRGTGKTGRQEAMELFEEQLEQQHKLNS